MSELEQVVARGSAERRTQTLRQITTLFLEGADQFTAEHVDLFDDVISYLIEEIETQALAELAGRIAPVPNAPREVVRILAGNDDIDVAGPVLQQARFDQPTLLDLAETKSQAHLLAMSRRSDISEALSHILVIRGDQNVVCSVVGNHRAQFSDHSFSKLVMRAQHDSELAEKVGSRNDIPPQLFRRLLLQATEVVQNRLLSRTKPETAAEIRKVLAMVSGKISADAASRNYSAAVAMVRARHEVRALDEDAVLGYADAGKYEETIAALATICGVPVEVVDRLMAGERYDPVLILARSAGLSWATTKAMITIVPGAKGTSTQAVEAARENFERLTTRAAQRVVHFWQVRQEASGAIDA